MSVKRITSLCIALAVVASAVTTSAVAQQREAEVALQQAMHAEQVEGDLERAIQLYRDIVARHGATTPSPRSTDGRERLAGGLVGLWS